MKVRITLEFDDDDRRLVRWRYGNGAGLASRAELIGFINGVISGGLEDIAGDQIAEGEGDDDE